LWVLVTGASSGFGEEFARQYAAQGRPLVLVARRLEKLETLAAKLRETNRVEVIVEQVDVSNVAAVIQLHQRLRERGIVFTGSTAVGRAVMKAASENLVPVTLELGGKSPTIVAKGSVQDRTVSSIVWRKLLSGGQTCIAPDYALVHESEVNTFIESYDRLVKAAYPDGPTSEDYTSIVNDQQYATLIGLIDDARAHGARIIEVGHRPADATHRPHTLAPTVVLGVTDEMKIAHEEIFGPILPIFGYGNIDDAINYVNARPRPLALYYFGDDDADRRKVLDHTTSGNVTINGTIMHVAQDDLPFGGVGASGMGAYHGVEGFRTLSHAKGIFEQGRWNFLDLLRAPFGSRANTLLELLLR
jgi:coniferyl-aldehyde dehydrogenase